MVKEEKARHTMALSASMGSPPSPLDWPESTLPRFRATRTRSSGKEIDKFSKEEIKKIYLWLISNNVNNTRQAHGPIIFLYLGKINATVLIVIVIVILLFLTKSHSCFLLFSQAMEATEAKEAIQKFWAWRLFRSLRTLETVSGSSPEWHQYMGQLFNLFLQSKGFIRTRESSRLVLCAIAFG